jgi:hypothetical protein
MLLAGLDKVREVGTFSSRNSSKGSMLKEAFALFSAARSGVAPENLRSAVMGGSILPRAAYETRRTVGRLLHHRYLSVLPGWVARAMADATKQGMQSPEFVSLAYLHYALRDRLTFEFVTGPVWTRWRQQATHLDRGDFLLFLGQQAPDHPEIGKWRDITQKRLASSNLSALRDFGLLRGVQRKHIQRPTVGYEAVFHLVCILMAEGLHGRAILEAPDWRLFLWSEADVAAALAELSQRRWIRFEKGGRTTMLELIRTPEVTP